MTVASDHARYEVLLATVLRARDPARALARAARDRRLPADLRRALAATDADGVCVAALLVAKLRFERLVRGCAEAEAWFDEDPEAFAAEFRRYHAAVPMSAFFPPAEAQLFRAFRARGRRGPS